MPLLAVVLLAAGACGGDGGGESSTADGTSSTTGAESPTADVDAAETVTTQEEPGRDDADTADDDADASEPSAEQPAADDDDARGSDEGPSEDSEDEAGTVVAPAETAPPEDPGEPEPQYGGTLRVAVEAEADGLNPAANNFAAANTMMARPVFDSLVVWSDEGRWVPHLAESFTKIGDGTSWQMSLRPGVRFHDGSGLDADDVVATFNAQLADPEISLALRTVYPDETPIEKIDEMAVQFNLTVPFAKFPQVLASQLGMILPSEWLARANEDPTLNQMPVGTGPFMIESRIQDEVTVLVRNPDYWAADRTDIYLDRIEFYPTTDGAIAAQRLAAGDLDLMTTNSPEAILALRESEGVNLIENVQTSEIMLLLNTQRAPFNDIRVRQALTFATDRDAYIDLIVQGTAPPADSMFHSSMVWNNPDVVQETNMAERAGPLVASYCQDNPDSCTEGRVNVEYQHTGPSVVNTRVADLLADSWEDHFNVTINEVLQDEHIIEVVLGDYDVVLWRSLGAVDPDNDVVWLECASIGLISINFPRWCDPDSDALMYEQRAIDEQARRVEIWKELQARMRDSYAYVFLNHTNWTLATSDSVHNVCREQSPDGVALLCNPGVWVVLNELWLG